MDARNKQRRDIKVFGYYDLTGPYDVVRYVQEKKVTVENSFDFIDIEKTLTQVSQGHHGSEINFQTASLSLDASSKVYGLRVDNLHNLLLQLRNSFRPKTCVVPDTECESRTSPKIEIRKEPHASKRIRSNYVEPDLLKTTGAIDVNLDMNDFCGKILLEVSGQEGSMGRIMSFLPPADMHPIDITQQDHWFEAGVMEDMRTLRPLPDIPIGLPISRLLETFSMDLQSGKHFSQESLHTSLEQDSDIRKYKFDPDADSLSTKRTVLYGDTIQETQASNLAVLKVIKKENSEISVPGERFTIDGTPIRAIEARGRPRKFIDLPFLPLLERMTQPGDEPECKQAPDYNLFNAAVLSLAPSSIRLSNATLTKWTSNCKKLRHPDPVEIRDLTFDSVVERFSSLFFLESYKVSIQEFPDGSAAKVDAPDIRLVKRKCSEPEESKFTAEIKSESQVASSSWPLDTKSTQEPEWSQTIAPDLMTTAIYLGHRTAQKKFNLKQMCQAMWDIFLISNSKNDVPVGDKGSKHLLSHLYIAIQPTLSPDNRRAINPQLAFVALLSLANEEKLNLVPIDEVDVCISQMVIAASSIPLTFEPVEAHSRSKGFKRSGLQRNKLKSKRLRLTNESVANSYG